MLRLDGISKHFDGQPIVQNLSLTVGQGEIVCLLGVSGGGKTTLLRCIAGLEKPDQGRIFLNEVDITKQPTNQRGMGLMFQEYALFPHLTVAQNIAFGLEMQKLPSVTITQRVSEILALVGLSGFEKRAVGSLSGGEQQRVALARSLAPQPRLLMLDEPLGALDGLLRDRLVVELREIMKTAGVTALYVTHDQQEAFAIADRIAILHQGQLIQVATPQQLYLHPVNRMVAEFLGLRNILPVDNLISTESEFWAETGIGKFAVSHPCTHLLFHPVYLRLAEEGIPMIVERSVFRGGMTQYHLVHASGHRFVLYVPSSQILPTHKTLHIQIQPQGVIPLVE